MAERDQYGQAIRAELELLDIGVQSAKPIETLLVPFEKNWIGSVFYEEGTIGDLMVKGIGNAIGKTATVVEIGIQKVETKIADVTNIKRK